MRDTPYVFKLTCSLFSVRVTVMKRKTVELKNGSCIIYNKNGILLGTDKLYHLKVESIAREFISIFTELEVENDVYL